MDTSVPSPLETLDFDDPGDDTQRRFRYQHAYGVILLASAIRGTSPYRAVWCEHHEDLLVESEDDRFESFLLKTRQPELGRWECRHEAFVASVGRCVELDGLFPGKFVQFHFVSNTAYFDPDSPKEAKKSPVQLKHAVVAAADRSALPEPFSTVLREWRRHWARMRSGYSTFGNAWS